MARRRLDFIVFSDDWGRHPSSCQHLVRHLARRHRVLWVNTIGMRAPKADGFTWRRGLEKLQQWSRPLRRINENLHVYAPPMLPTSHGLGARVNGQLTSVQIRAAIRRVGLIKPVLLASVPTAADYVGRLGERALVYYITDDYRRWPGANAETIARQDALLTDRADLLLPCSAALAEGRTTAGRVEMLPHAVDLEHFAGLGPDAAEPTDLASISRPRLCFFGLIYEKVDLAMLRRLALEQPARQIVLIGPIRTDVSMLGNLPNVHLLGPRPYEELPAYLHHMDVLMLSYVLDEQIRRSGPLKIRECLAVGKPTVAVDVPDLRRYADLIHLAATQDAFLAACDDACRDNIAPDRAAMRQAVAADTWDARARQVEDALDKALAAPRLGAAAISKTDEATPLSDATSANVCRDGQAWDSYITQHMDGSVWHRWGWSQAMRAAYGMPCLFLQATRGARTVGVLPLALQEGPAFGRCLTSLPWLDHAGLLAEDTTAASALMTAARSHAQQRGADLVIRQLTRQTSPPDVGACQVRHDKTVMMLDLPSEPDRLWKTLKAKVRNQVRKAQKCDLTAQWGGSELLGEFHSVYSTNMRDLGSPPHSSAFFRTLMMSLSDVARLLVVRSEGKAVAGAFILADERCWQTPWASSLRAANSMCPSHLLYWTILSAACGSAPCFSFGRSSRDSGTYRFKAQWGAREAPLAWYRWPLKAHRAATGDDPGQLVELVQQVWRRIPASLARALGPSIIRTVG